MTFLLAIAAFAGGVLLWLYRMHTSTTATAYRIGMAEDVQAAALRFGFRRRRNADPVDSIDDLGLAQGALSVAFSQRGRPGPDDQRLIHLRALQRHLDVSPSCAEEILILSHWFVAECNGPAAAVSRLGKRLLTLGGYPALDPALSVINDVTRAQGGLNEDQRDALHELTAIFRRG